MCGYAAPTKDAGLTFKHDADIIKIGFGTRVHVSMRGRGGSSHAANSVRGGGGSCGGGGGSTRTARNGCVWWCNFPPPPSGCLPVIEAKCRWDSGLDGVLATFRRCRPVQSCCRRKVRRSPTTNGEGRTCHHDESSECATRTSASRGRGSLLPTASATLVGVGAPHQRPRVNQQIEVDESSISSVVMSHQYTKWMSRRCNVRLHVTIFHLLPGVCLCRHHRKWCARQHVMRRWLAPDSRELRYWWWWRWYRNHPYRLRGGALHVRRES